MNPVFEAALELQSFCQQERWRFCFIGGVAVQRWGEPRLTVDVDITLLTGFGGEEPFIRALLARFQPRRSDAAEFALRNRVLLVENSQEVGMDVALGGLPFEARSVERASAFNIGGEQHLITCSAEDLVVHKCFASRDQDWIDVRGVLEKQRGKLSLAQIYDELTPLVALKEQPEIVERLRGLVEKVAAAP